MSKDIVTLWLGKYCICLLPHGSGMVRGVVEPLSGSQPICTQVWLPVLVNRRETCDIVIIIILSLISIKFVNRYQIDRLLGYQQTRYQLDQKTVAIIPKNGSDYQKSIFYKRRIVTEYQQRILIFKNTKIDYQGTSLLTTSWYSLPKYLVYNTDSTVVSYLAFWQIQCCR